MDQGSARQPGQQRGILHWIPEPPAAPAQLVVGPPGAQGDTHGEKAPGDGGPGPGPTRPGRVHIACQQTGHGKSKGHRKAHITHVQHGRVNDQARVLQQRIQIRPVQREPGQDPIEGIGCEQHEQQEAHRDHAHHGQHPGDHVQGNAATQHPDHGRPAAQHPAPQQQRALVPTPYGGQPIGQRQRGVAVIGHIGHREVVNVEAVAQADHGKGQCQPLHPGQRAGIPLQGKNVTMHPDQREY